MGKVNTDPVSERIGRRINGNFKGYADQPARTELNLHDDRIANLETGTPFATCATAGATQAKAVTINNFVLKTNAIVSILFTNGFTASNPTLNISSTGAKSILLNGAAIPLGKVRNNTILTMIYDGTNFNVIAIETNAPATPGAVDLGLPSGRLWADKNVGAQSPEEFGYYFSWGNVAEHCLNGVNDYDFGSANTGPYASTPGAALTGNIAVGNTYDAARKHMGEPWRLPTKDDFVELNANCTSEWLTQNGVAGRRFTSNKNGNSIFIPAAGFFSGTTLYYRGEGCGCWSSTLYSEAHGYGLSFNASGVSPQNYSIRFYGFTVRAVQ